MLHDPMTVATRYIDVWNRADPAERRKGVEDLWMPDGLHFTPTRRFQGYDALEARVLEAYEQFVRRKCYLFHVMGQPLGHHSVVKLHWKMQHRVTGSIDAFGSDVLLLSDDSRIVTDFQFLEPSPATSEGAGT